MAEEDFGFSMVSEIPTTEAPAPTVTPDTVDALAVKVDTILQLLQSPTGAVPIDSKLKQLEEIIIPLLEGLAANPTAQFIKWPNRKPILDAKVAEVYRITRS